MATWTQDEIDQLKAAILALASGEKVQIVTYAGPPQRSVQYHPVNLPEMRKLLAEMIAQVGPTRYRRVQVKRGFRDG